MGNWWTEDNMKTVVTDRIDPDETLEHCFQAFSFGPSFDGLLGDLFDTFAFNFKEPDRYIFAMTNAAVYFVKHRGQFRVEAVLEVVRFPFSDIAIKAKGGCPGFNAVRFQGADGWEAKMLFPFHRKGSILKDSILGTKYKPSSSLTDYEQIVEKLRSRCQPIGK